MAESPYPLTTLYLYLIDFCNLRCRHCWVSPLFSTTPPPPKITFAELESALSEAKKLGLKLVKFTGGEPLLHPEFPKILRLASSLSVQLALETNGTLLDEGIVELLCALNVHVSVSLDGASPQTHDAFRGVHGCFEKTVTGIEKLVACGNPPLVIFSVYKGNLGELESIVRLCADLGVKSLKVNVIAPMGRAKGMARMGILLTPFEQWQLKREVEPQLSEKYGISIFVDLPCAFAPLSHLERGYPRCPFLNLLSILADGSVTFCGFGYAHPQFIMGNIKTDSLTAIWHDHPLLHWARGELPMNLKGICGQCLFRTTCLGHCRALVLDLFGDLTAPDPYCQSLYESGLFPETRLRFPLSCGCLSEVGETATNLVAATYFGKDYQQVGRV